MASLNLYNAEVKDVPNIIDLLLTFKEEEGLHLPNVDEARLKKSLLTFLKKGHIILLKDLDIDQLIGCAIWFKSTYWFSTSECVNLHTIYVKKSFRNFRLLTLLFDSIKKSAKQLPIYLAVTSGIEIDPVFKKLGFKSLGSNWRYN